MNALDAAELLIANGDWPAARRVLELALLASPHDHWLRSRLGATYYETGDYSTALQHFEDAKEAAPKCPIALWDYAGTLQQLGRHETAVGIYEALLKRQVGWLTKDLCLQSRALAKGLIADSQFRLSRSLDALGRKEAADAAFLAHLHMRGPGCYSLYSLDMFPRRGSVLRLWRQRKKKGQRAPAAISKRVLLPTASPKEFQ